MKQMEDQCQSLPDHAVSSRLSTVDGHLLWIVPLQNVEVVLEPESIPGGPEAPEEPEEPTTPDSPENPPQVPGNTDASAQPLPPQVGPGMPPELG